MRSNALLADVLNRRMLLVVFPSMFGNLIRLARVVLFRERSAMSWLFL